MTYNEIKQKLLKRDQEYSIVVDTQYGSAIYQSVIFLGLEAQGYYDDQGMWTKRVTGNPVWFIRCKEAQELVFLSIKNIRSIKEVRDKDIGVDGKEVIDIEAVGPNVFQKVVESGNTDSVWGHLAGIETFIEQGHTEYCACHMHNGGDSCQCQKKPVRAGTGKVRYE